MKYIQVQKARVHNLKGVSVDIPRNKLTVITGPSGSGKSSLAFDTIYAEGQRRYIESLSSYARQFLGQIDPPDVESITGLSPSIAIDQKSTSHNPRSTVGTVTEIYDYLRVLYARVATAHCPETGKVLEAQTPQQMVHQLLKLKEKTKLHIMAPIVQHQKGEHKEMLAKYMAQGYSRVRLNGDIISLDEEISVDKNKRNNIDLVVDRIVVKTGIQSRLADSVELALQISKGSLVVDANGEEIFMSESLYSKDIGKSYPELSPRTFSFNSPLGACPQCNGLGVHKVFDASKYILDDSLPVLNGAIGPLYNKNAFLVQMVKSVLKEEKVSEKTALKDVPKNVQKILFQGSDKVYTYSFVSERSQFNFKKPFVGIEAWLENKYRETESEKTREGLEEFMAIETCQTCDGKRLNPYALSATINDYSIMDLCQLPLDECYEVIQNFSFTGDKAVIAEKVLKEVTDRLTFLLRVGLSYLTLSRSATDLSGGESQRIRLATQIGSALSGVVYVLDEPSIGLHQRDNDKLIHTLKDLRDLDNTVIVVEHDEDTMLEADYLIDIGPGAGVHGGTIVAQGTPGEVINQSGSTTADFLSGKRNLAVPSTRRNASSFIDIKGATRHNLENLDISFPLGNFSVLSGVSGSGKSTLVHQILIPGLKNKLRGFKARKKYFQTINGFEKIDSLIELDQKPIGRTPKSNPATYTKLFDGIRAIFASTNEAKVRGYKQGRFSFNVKGGRCETCEGNGSIKVEMNFLPDVFVTCSECEGRRYNKETLNILYRGKNIADVLEMTIEEAKDFFEHHPKIARALCVLDEIGLGYITLGQPAPTLSGGEAQRLKLARELSKKTKGHCLYVLDEPTTGLHFQDIQVLLGAINRLVDQGNSVLVIEHNLDVIKSADYVIDLGPEGGKFGGRVVAEGTPEQVSKVKGSHTAKYLKKALDKRTQSRAPSIGLS
jgi:excinuclease ABC subunit A